MRIAVREYGKYSLAWVTLGQVLSAQKRVDEAKVACAQATIADPVFAPAYLCLADLAARSHDWLEVLQWSERALGLGTNYAAVAYEYNAAANLNLHNLPAAEKSGLRAVEMDRDHREPRAHFVLAQVYEAKGDRENEIKQLREYLKYAGDAADLAIINRLCCNWRADRQRTRRRTRLQRKHLYKFPKSPGAPGRLRTSTKKFPPRNSMSPVRWKKY